MVLGAAGGTFLTAADLLVNGTISGTRVLTKQGAAKLTLTNDNTYNGGTTISAGTLQIGNGGTSGVIVGNVFDSGAFAFNRSDSGDVWRRHQRRRGVGSTGRWHNNVDWQLCCLCREYIGRCWHTCR